MTNQYGFQNTQYMHGKKYKRDQASALAGLCSSTEKGRHRIWRNDFQCAGSPKTWKRVLHLWLCHLLVVCTILSNSLTVSAQFQVVVKIKVYIKVLCTVINKKIKSTSVAVMLNCVWLATSQFYFSISPNNGKPQKTSAIQ